jgi:hypothetical protein
VTIKWDLPNSRTPGFLRRRRDLLELLHSDGTPENLDKLAQYLVQFVTGPITHDQALVEIMDMPLEEYAGVITGLLASDLQGVPGPLGDRSGPR